MGNSERSLVSVRDSFHPTIKTNKDDISLGRHSNILIFVNEYIELLKTKVKGNNKHWDQVFNKQYALLMSIYFFLLLSRLSQVWKKPSPRGDGDWNIPN